MTSNEPQNNKHDQLRTALNALRHARTHIEELERSRNEPIAIVGMSCKYPGHCNSVDAFWRALMQGVDAVVTTPPDRWDAEAIYDPDPDTPGRIYVREGGFVDDIFGFDHAFFGISPREAQAMDPQQRLVMELIWHAMEHAGIPHERVRAACPGVFVGVTTTDYGDRLKKMGPDRLGLYEMLSIVTHTNAGRAAYSLGFNGPAIAVDTACSSSLVTTHLACQALRNGDCHAAFVAGINVTLDPDGIVMLCRGKMLSPEGRCKTFDADANGFGRSEGAGVMLLKRGSDAKRDGDTVYALIKGTAVNHNGASGGLTVPSGKAQQEVVRKALRHAGLKPEDIDFVEAHGTGTSLGDPIELAAIQAVFDPGRDRPIYVGSAKTNFGHMESAAGVAGVMKAALALHNRRLPPHIHLNELNPAISMDGSHVIIPSDPVDLPAPDGKRIYAGVSSFGGSGTNAHAILQSVPVDSTTNKEQADPPHQLLTLSARSDSALRAMARSYAELIRDGDSHALPDICHSAWHTRTRLPYRLAMAADHPGQAVDLLAAHAEHRPLPRQQASVLHCPDIPGRLMLMFTGQGSQRIGMGRQLYEQSDTFRNAFDRCAEVLDGMLDVPLKALVFEPNELIDQTQYTQPALFALEYALWELWAQWGVKPDLLIGHSIGEYVAATVAEVFDLADALKLVAIRGQLMGQLPSGGAMTAVFAPEDVIRPMLDLYAGSLDIAAYNGPVSNVISGDADAMAALLGEYEKAGVQYKPLVVSHAFHSKLMEPILSEFAGHVRNVRISEPKTPLISNVTGEVATPGLLTDPDYWVQHIRQGVRFAQGIDAAIAKGARVMLEVGPGHSMAGMARRCLDPEQATKILPIASLSDPDHEARSVVQAAGAMWCGGHEVKYTQIDPVQRNRVVLPSYPFDRHGDLFVQASTHRSQELESALDRAVAAIVDEGLNPDEQQLLARLRERMKSAGAADEPEGSASNTTYQVVWREAVPATLEDESNQAWLIIDYEGSLGQQLTQQLESLGHDVTRLTLQPEAFLSEQDGDHDRSVIETSIGDLLLAHTSQSLKVVNLCGLSIGQGQELDAYPLQHAYRSTLSLLQLLAKSDRPIRYHGITSGAVCTGPDNPVHAPTQAALWGLSRVAFEENPQLVGSMIDLDPTDLHDDALPLDVWLNTNEPGDYAIRNGAVLTARLEPSRAFASVSIHPKINEHATYLITGGCGGLGLAACERLVARGAQRLLLISRRGEREGIKPKLDKLRDTGVTIGVVKASVDDEAAMTQIFKQCRDGSCPISGVVHAAGTTGDRLLSQQSWSHFQLVAAPKVHGTEILYRLVDQYDVDWVVSYGSASALFGAAGQANYASANAYLEALASYAQARGHAMFNIAWGPWAQVGMASERGLLDQMARIGVSGIEPAVGLDAQETVMKLGVCQSVIVDVDWPVFASHIKAAGTRALISDLACHPASVGVRSTDPSKLWRDALDAETNDRVSHVELYVRHTVARVLRFDQPDMIDLQLPLTDLGIDSLMAVELRIAIDKDTHVNLPLSELIGGGSGVGIVTALSASLENAPIEQDKPKHAQDLLDNLDGLSEEQVDQLLRQMGNGDQRDG